MLKNTLTKKKSLLIAGGIAGVLVLGGGGVALASGLDDGVSAQTRDRAQEAALAETGGGTVTEVDTLDDGLVGYEVEVVLPDGREATVLLDDDCSVTSSRVDDDDSRGSGATPTPVAGEDRDDDSLGSDATPTPVAGSGRDDSTRDDSARDDDLTGADYDRAAAAALAAAGGGTVTDADRSDDTGVAYEVDVRLDDGTEVDVDLDQAFGVVRTDVDARR
ncbi:PepSY domain-containing protein [Frigoribacterium sp. CFBP 13605]|uniref:PepSY domain-containing protein n=1 Tax=Frigoribacterium sp. CFBP 13605 TaxID=2774034 RepID=UPI00190444A4|nr:PepSY domain-containing protein [Frigoribacterium sp. CFBP 13605]MBD8140455.1 PepSY domain-containing protein [Frigoribacterium sp. CFBP 13605]